MERHQMQVSILFFKKLSCTQRHRGMMIDTPTNSFAMYTLPERNKIIKMTPRNMYTRGLGIKDRKYNFDQSPTLSQQPGDLRPAAVDQSQPRYSEPSDLAPHDS